MVEKIVLKASYLLMGLSIGSLTSILFAPKSGKETRKYLAQKVKEASEYAQNKARKQRELAEELINRGKEVVTRRRQQIAAAVEVGREAYQREKSNAQGRRRLDRIGSWRIVR
jgi:gas vesicle protein